MWTLPGHEAADRKPNRLTVAVADGRIRGPNVPNVSAVRGTHPEPDNYRSERCPDHATNKLADVAADSRPNHAADRTSVTDAYGEPCSRSTNTATRMHQA